MPATPHIEKHFTASESVRDVVIGMADGLTVPFALAAGLSAAVVSTRSTIYAQRRSRKSRRSSANVALKERSCRMS